jgi:hypothetical protein
MRTRKKLTGLFLLIISVNFITTSCKKVTTTKTYTISNQASQSDIAGDEVTINNSLDQYIDDAVAILSNHNAAISGGYGDSANASCLEITYSGTKEPDGVESRTGVDSIHFSSKTPWNTPGATATLSFKDVNTSGSFEEFYNSIISPSSGDTASLTFFGTITITNLSGGFLQNVTQSDSMVIQIRANTSFTFNDQSTVIQTFPLHINEVRTYTLSNTTMYATTRGDTSISGYLNVGSWGTNRLSNNYYTAIIHPMVQNITNLVLSYNPLSGTKVIEGITEPITCNYGLNNQGQAVASGTTPYGYSIAWIDNSIQANYVLPYYY